MNNFLLDFLALGAILSGILVITSKNPVISVLFLISVFVNVAGYLVLLGVGFIGISYLIVYVGAIAILFLFVVMMLNLQLTELSAVGTEYTQNLPLGTIIGSLFLFELVSIVPGFTASSASENGTFNISTVTNLLPQAELGILNWFNSLFLGVDSAQYSPLTNSDVHYTFNTAFGAADTQFASFLQIQSIGYSIYTTGALWLIVASVILLLAMVGPITLSMNKTPANLTIFSPLSLSLFIVLICCHYY
jgi:NADH-ubiquinone oxidoreductase chain 6